MHAHGSRTFRREGLPLFADFVLIPMLQPWPASVLLCTSLSSKRSDSSCWNHGTKTNEHRGAMNAMITCVHITYIFHPGVEGAICYWRLHTGAMTCGDGRASSWKHVLSVFLGWAHKVVNRQDFTLKYLEHSTLYLVVMGHVRSGCSFASNRSIAVPVLLVMHIFDGLPAPSNCFWLGSLETQSQIHSSMIAKVWFQYLTLQNVSRLWTSGAVGLFFRCDLLGMLRSDNGMQSICWIFNGYITHWVNFKVKNKCLWGQTVQLTRSLVCSSSSSIAAPKMGFEFWNHHKQSRMHQWVWRRLKIMCVLYTHWDSIMLVKTCCVYIELQSPDCPPLHFVYWCGKGCALCTCFWAMIHTSRW